MSESKDHSIFIQPDLFETCFPAMEEIRRKGKLCDVTLKLDGESFTAHKLVLASVIPYFSAMFLNDMQESKLSEIEIHDVDVSAFESLVNFAYSGRILINCDNVQSLMLASTFLQMTAVREACAQHMAKQLAPSNALGVRKFGAELGCVSLLKLADVYINKHFDAVSQCSEFVELEEPELCVMLSNDQLHVNSEEAVFEALMRWVMYDTELRSDCLHRLLHLIRMPLLTPQYITDHVATHTLIRSSLPCRDLLDEARDYMLMPERRCSLHTFTTRPRCCTDIVGLIYVVGGLAKCGGSLSTVESYNPVTGEWTCAEKMSRNRSRVGVTALSGWLYAIGGFNGVQRLATVEVLETTSDGGGHWRQVAPMKFRRSAVGAVSLNQCVYVCGGYDGVNSLSSVERYDPALNSWTQLAAMMRHRSAAGVVAFDGRIFVLGGHDGLSIFDSVECYDPVKGVWSCGVPMLTKRCRLGAAVLNGMLYACGGYDGCVFLRSVERFDPTTNSWSYVSPMSVTRSRVSVAAVMGRLYAVGGYDGAVNLSSVEMYEPEHDRWRSVADMARHEGGVGVGVLRAVEHV